MSLRETVNAFGRDVSEHFKRDSYCSFAPSEETEGFVDTSAELDGSRGIAFLCDRIRVDFDGVIRQLNYDDIRETEIIESFESDYADELLIKGRTTVRVSDFSINKRFLKLLVDTLCLRYKQFQPEERENSAGNAVQEAPQDTRRWTKRRMPRQGRWRRGMRKDQDRARFLTR